MARTLKIELNGTALEVSPGVTVLGAAREAGVEIPTLCYDDMVEPYAGCGLCLVEAEGSRRLIRACSTAAADGMKIYTDTPKVRKARKAQLEMLIADHEGDCQAPCHLACPGKTDCQGYVGLIANGMYKEALALIMDKIPLPGSIGRVCPHPCEDECRRKLAEEPISICSLKRFAADACAGDENTPDAGEDTGFKVAVVGGGPAGLSAAYFLRKMGHAVTVYEELPKMGGMLRYGIPEYRLPKAVLDAEIGVFARMGVEMVNGVRIGRDITLDELRERFDRVFVGVGAGKSVSLGCPGEDLKGVFGGVEFLRSVAEGSLTRLEGAVAVVGGGDTAMDACRTAVRLGAGPVYVVYRRTVDEMPANAHEIKEALEEGVIFRNLRNPIEIEGEDGAVKRVRLRVMELGEPDESGRRAPVPVAGAEETLAVDHVIVMIGQAVDAEGLESLALGRKKTITAGERFETSVPGVYAAGDAVNKGPGIAIEAIGQAREAAEHIHRSLMGGERGSGDGLCLSGAIADNGGLCPSGAIADNGRLCPSGTAEGNGGLCPSGTIADNSGPCPSENFLVKSVKTEADFADHAKQPRESGYTLPAEERKTGFMEAAKGLGDAAARREAARCLECGCMAYYDCKLLKYAREYGVAEADAPRVSARVRRVIDMSPDYFVRDMNKCVLCRLCVRVCGEVAGRNALGVANRGFETYVLPEMGRPLRETACTDCGQCVAVCPTGALTDKNGRKRVPLPERRTASVCGYCGVGCLNEIAAYGGMITRILPGNGTMCAKGRYGFAEDIYKERVLRPMLRKSGAGLEEAGFDEVCAFIKSETARIAEEYGQKALAVGISGSLTNEEIAAAMDFAGRTGASEAGNVYRLDAEAPAFAGAAGALSGMGVYTGAMEGLKSADVIIFAESGGSRCEVAKFHIKKAVENGAKLILVGNGETYSRGWADIALDNSYMDGEKASEAARIYAAAGNAVIVLDSSDEGFETGALGEFLRLAVDSRGQKSRKFLRLLPEANSRRLTELGVGKWRRELRERLQSGEIKGLVLFGGETGLDKIPKPEFLAAVSRFLTAEAATSADALLPAAAPWETSGTLVNASGEARRMNAAAGPAGGLETERVIRGIV